MNSLDNPSERGIKLPKRNWPEETRDAGFGPAGSVMDGFFELTAAGREVDDAGAAVGRVRSKGEVPEALDSAQQVVDRLLGDAQPLGEFGGAKALRGWIPKYPDLGRAEVRVPGFVHAGVDLFEHPVQSDAHHRADEGSVFLRGG